MSTNGATARLDSSTRPMETPIVCFTFDGLAAPSANRYLADCGSDQHTSHLVRVLLKMLSLNMILLYNLR